MRHGLSRAGAANRAVGPAGGGRRIWLTAVIAAVLFPLYGTPQAAWAHNALLGTTPADGAQVKMAPATVVLTFNEPAISTGTKVLVTGPDGPVAVGAPALIDNTVQQELKPGLPAGEYTVEWRVTSADGHPINGSFSFEALAGSASDLPTTVSPAASPRSTPSSVTGNEEPGQGSGWLWWFAAVPVGLALVLGWRFSRR